MNNIKLHIRKGDTVVVITGKDKKKKGQVISVDPQKRRVVVEGINICVKRIKPNAQTPQGRIEKVESSIHISNVMLWDPTANKPSKVGRRLSIDGKIVKYFKNSKEEIK